MSYKSYAETELQIAGGYDDIKDIVFELLEVAEDEGHSGGSMSIFGPAFMEWAKDPKPVTDADSLIKPYWEKIKHLTPEQAKRIAWAVARIQTFTPLSPIGDTPEEWNDVTEYGDGKERIRQHRRISSIFKRNDEPAYWLDAELHVSPYDDFSFFGGTHKSQPIEFPFDPETKTKKFYYYDETHTHPFGPDVDPNEWLKEKRDLYLCGQDVNGRFKEDHWMLDTDEEIEEVTRLYKLFLEEKHAFKDKRDLGWTISDIYHSEVKPYRLDKTSIVASSYRVLKNVCRLAYRNWDGTFEETMVCQIKQPTANYQGWETVKRMVIERLSFGSALYFDKDRLIAASAYVANKYLYNKCKELGLEYKGKRA